MAQPNTSVQGAGGGMPGMGGWALEAAGLGLVVLPAAGIAAGRDRRRRGIPARRLGLGRHIRRWGAVRLGEQNHDLEAAFGTGADAQVRMVGGGHGGHDRQAQAVALVVAGAVGPVALEGPQEPVDLGGRDRRPAVGHQQHGAPRPGAGLDLDPAGLGIRTRIRRLQGGYSACSRGVTARPLHLHQAPPRRGVQVQTDRRNRHAQPATPTGRPRRTAMTRTRMGLVPGLLLALTLAVAACGSGGNSDGVASVGGKATATTSAGGGGDPQQAALAFARCMRQHGVNLPDPQITADGIVQLPEQKSPKSRAAEQACRQYLPNGGQPASLTAQERQRALALARCMRQHGITNMPDPQFTGNRLVQDPPPGMELGDPKFKAAEQACVQFLPAGKPRPQSGGGGR
jgi:hypothetical protein